MVCSGADNSDADSIPHVPASKAIDDIDPISCIKVVNCSFTVDLPYL